MALSDGDLARKLEALAGDEREILLDVLWHLAEFDRRKLYASEGYPSLFEYCTRRLRHSEGAAYRRIQAARLLRRFPAIADYLRDGRASLTTLTLLGPVLTENNVRDLLERAAGGSRLELQRLVASLAPKPEAADSIRKLPAARPVVPPPALPAAEPAAPAPTNVSAVARPPPAPDPARPLAALVPVSERRTKVQFTVGDEFLEDLARARALLSHKFPQGGLEEVVGEALKAVVRERSRARGSHGVPVAVVREVWERDGGRCAYRGPDGRRCGSTHQVEFDHVVPVAAGGAATAANGRLHCRTHNQLQARLWFGAAFMEQKIRPARAGEGLGAPA